MDGLEAIEISYKEVQSNIRIDAELYQRAYIKADEAVRKISHTTLGTETVTLKKGIFDIAAELYTSQGVPFVRISNLRNMMIDATDIAFIPESENIKNIQTRLVKGDVVLSKTAYAAASLVTVDECNVSQDTVAIKLKSKSQLLSRYLVAYLNSSHYGLRLMQRWFTGNIQAHLNLEDCKDIKVPVFSQTFQETIAKLFDGGWSLLQVSTDSYKSAEQLLLQHLGLANYTPTTANTSVHNFKNSFGASGRFDAEFYEPRFDELETRLHSIGNIKKLGVIAPFITRGKQPNYSEDGELIVVNSKHVREDKVIIDDNRYAIPEEDSLLIRKGDVLMNGTGVGTIGRCAPFLHDMVALPDNHVTIIRPTLDPVYLSVYLSSIVGQLQVDKFFKGSSGQIELYPSDMSEFLVWEAPEAVQQEIRVKVEESYVAQQKSQRLLELAKLGVEKAIEEGESITTTWLEKQLEGIG